MENLTKSAICEKIVTVAKRFNEEVEVKFVTQEEAMNIYSIACSSRFNKESHFEIKQGEKIKCFDENYFDCENYEFISKIASICFSFNPKNYEADNYYLGHVISDLRQENKNLENELKARKKGFSSYNSMVKNGIKLFKIKQKESAKKRNIEYKEQIKEVLADLKNHKKEGFKFVYINQNWSGSRRHLRKVANSYGFSKEKTNHKESLSLNKIDKKTAIWVINNL